MQMRIIGGIAVFILVGAGIALLVNSFQNNNDDSLNLNITSPVEVIAAQTKLQHGSQEGDEQVYAQYVDQLVIGRLGLEQPGNDDAGNVLYRPEDQITFTLVTPDSITAPFRVHHEIYNGNEERISKSELFDMNPGANTSCCIQAPDDAGEYALRFYIDDELFAARYFAVR